MKHTRFAGFVLSCPLLLLAGCGVKSITVPSAARSLNGITGQVHGGQQPVSGSTIQLYTVGTTGDGSAATPLLTQPVTTTANGIFTITGLYSCSGATQVYVTATGGNPGLGTNNPNLAMMTALGPCSALTPSTFINVNELTTVGAVSPLVPFMSSAAAIGSGSSDAAALAAAFALSSELVDPLQGTSPGNNIPTGMSIPVTQINTLADVLAACINSGGGRSGDGSSCGSLFSLTTPGGSAAPTDTILALLNIQRNPTQNIQALVNMVTPAAPFQPTVTVTPATLAVALQQANLLSATPSLSFADTAVGTAAAAQSAVLLNTTASTVPVSGVSLAGANPADFQITNGCLSSLGKGLTCPVQVTFAPLAAGARDATLLINAGGVVSSTAVSGNGLVASTGPVTVSPASLSFIVPDVAQTVTVSNFSSNTLGITGITFSSPNFTQTNDCGTQLSGQSLCHIFVTATHVTGSFSGSMTVVDTDTADAQTVQLASSIPSFQGTLFWGVGTPTLNNQKVLQYQVGTITPLQGGRWRVNQCSPYVCVVDFFANQVGYNYAIAAGSLWSGYGASDTANFGISPGTTAVPPFTFTSVDFGSPTRGSTVSQSFTVTNLSTVALTFNPPTVQVNGQNFGDFSAGGNCTTLQGVAVSVGSPTCTLAVSFTPKLIGPRFAVVTLSDTAGQSFSFNVTGYGQYNAPGAQASLAFGNVGIGSSSTLNASTIVPYSHALSASIVNASTSPFSLQGIAYCNGVAGTCVIPVTFTPTTSGPANGTLVLTDSVSGLTGVTQLSGTGYFTTTDTISPGSLTFSPRNVGTSSIPQPITVTNTGTAALTFTSIGVSGGSAADYSVTNNCFPSVAVNASCTIQVTNKPTQSGPSSSSILIVSSAINSPQSVTVSGTGN